jgi:hypothetical protein
MEETPKQQAAVWDGSVRELRAAVCNHSPLLVGTIYKDKMMMQHLVTQTMKIRAWEATTLVNCSF